MKVQWYLSEDSIEWCRRAGDLLGITSGAFVERLIRYHAGHMTPEELDCFVYALEKAQDTIDFEWRD